MFLDNSLRKSKNIKTQPKTWKLLCSNVDIVLTTSLSRRQIKLTQRHSLIIKKPDIQYGQKLHMVTKKKNIAIIKSYHNITIVCYVYTRMVTYRKCNSLALWYLPILKLVKLLSNAILLSLPIIKDFFLNGQGKRFLLDTTQKNSLLFTNKNC